MCTSRCVLTFGALITTFGFTVLAIALSETLPRYLFSGPLKESTCTVTGQVFYGNVCCVETQADPDIWNLNSCIGITYPCYGVNVQYTKEDSTTQKGTLFDGYVEQRFQGDNITCSKYNCPSGTTYESAMSDITEYLNVHNSGSSTDCWYDPDDESNAFDGLPTTESMFIHAVVWSTLLFLIGIVVVVVSFVFAERLDREADDAEDNRVLVKGGELCPEIRTEGDAGNAYGTSRSNTSGAMVEVDPDRPTTAAAKGLMVKSKDVDGNSLFVPSQSTA